jgi:abortive infection bacteriophage resistance protein
LTYEQQLHLLEKRGLVVDDPAMALDYLSRIGYYRLSAYWYPLRKFSANAGPGATAASSPRTRAAGREDDFRPGATFQQVLDLYVFDKKLRLLLLDALERVEVSVRVDVAYRLSAKDIFAHENPALLDTRFVSPGQSGEPSKHQLWLLKQNDLIRKSREEFVAHFQNKYGLPLPIWASIELWDFGMLSKFYEGMKGIDKHAIATQYKLPNRRGELEDWQLMQSWLRTLNFIRNVAAHHSRLWNKNLVDQPKLPKRRGDLPVFDPLVGNPRIVSRLYVVLCILSYFMTEICPQTTWRHRVVELVKAFPDAPDLSVADMGFPEDWESQAFWA